MVSPATPFAKNHSTSIQQARSPPSSPSVPVTPHAAFPSVAPVKALAGGITPVEEALRDVRAAPWSGVARFAGSLDGLEGRCAEGRGFERRPGPGGRCSLRPMIAAQLVTARASHSRFEVLPREGVGGFPFVTGSAARRRAREVFPHRLLCVSRYVPWSRRGRARPNSDRREAVPAMDRAKGHSRRGILPPGAARTAWQAPGARDVSARVALGMSPLERQRIVRSSLVRSVTPVTAR